MLVSYNCSPELRTLELSSHGVTLVGGNSRCRQWWSGHGDKYLTRTEKHSPESMRSPKEQGIRFSVKSGMFQFLFAFLSLSDLVQVILINCKAQYSHVWSEKVEQVQ